MAIYNLRYKLYKDIVNGCVINAQNLEKHKNFARFA